MQRAGMRVAREHCEAACTGDIGAAAVRAQRERTCAAKVTTGSAAVGRGATNAPVGALELAQNARAAITPEGRDSAAVANRGIDISTVASSHESRDLVEGPARLALPSAALSDARVAPRKRSEVRRNTERQGSRNKGRKHATGP